LAGTFVAATTESDPFPQQGTITLKRDANAGDLLWTAKEPGAFDPSIPAGVAHAAHDIALAPDGAIFVSACSNYFTEPYTGNGYHDVLLIKYGADGQKAWQTEYHNLVCGNAPMAIDDNGDIVVASSAGPGFFGRDWLTLKFNGATGQLRWFAQYDGSSQLTDSVYEVTTDHSGNVYATGVTYRNESTWDGLTVKLNGSDGHPIWEATQGQSSGTVFEAIAVDPYDGVVVVGGSQRDLITTRYLQDIDDDQTPDPSDNCPIDANSDQTDSDSDALGDLCDEDDDNDRVADMDEGPCGGDALNVALRPERADTLADDDGDTVANEPLPADTSTFDCDGDGFSGAAEEQIYSYGQQPLRLQTNPDQDPCGDNGWPADLSPSNHLNIGDINAFLFPSRPDGSFNKLGHSLPDLTDPALSRFDLQPDGRIDVSDMNALNPGVNAPTSQPPMFSSQPAFFANAGSGVGVCPWPG
jgi:hypothetical protein